MTMREFAKKKIEQLRTIWPVLASLGGAMVMLLAFFIPSVQDQWDRYESRKIIDRYETLGNEFMLEEEYKMAEDAYARAFELSEEKRLDIEMKRLEAKISRVNVETEWGAPLPEDLHEIDFQFLLHFLKVDDHDHRRISAMDCYGVYLAHAGREQEAEKIFRKILSKNPNETLTHLNLGNLLEHQGMMQAAEESYHHAIRIEPLNGWAHYYLAHVLLKQGRIGEAAEELDEARRLDPADRDVAQEYDSVLRLLNVPAVPH